MKGGVMRSEVYNRIEGANTDLTVLLESLGFDDVIRGYPENINIFTGTVATSYITGGGFEDTMGGHNLPKTLNTVIGLICRGTKTEAHDNIVGKSLDIMENFSTSEDWITLKGNVRNSRITDFNIYPEITKKVALTTAVFILEHEINWRGV